LHPNRDPRQRPGTVLVAVSTTLAAAALGGSAASDVVNSYYGNSSNFNYRVLHMPDLDQKRTTLPNNGSNHCAPTSAINLFAYAANHGFPIGPGSGNWQSQSKYSQATSNISAMGAFMGTTGSGGTSGSGAASGYQFWILQNPYLTYIGYSKSSSYTPTVPKMAKLATQGWIIACAYGRYVVTGSIGGVPVVSREPGHVVTLNRAYASGGTRLIKYRDPATDSSSLTTQSTFTTRTVTWTPVTISFGGTDVRTMSAIDYPSSDGKIRIIDSYRAIRPLWGMMFFPGTGVAAAGGSLKAIDPVPFDGSINLQMPSVPISASSLLLDLGIHPDPTEAYILTKQLVGGPSTLRVVDLFDGTNSPLPQAPGDIARFVVDRKGNLISYDTAGKLYRLRGDTGAILNAISSNPLPADVAPHDATDSFWLASVSQRRLVRYSESLGVLSNWIVPTPVPMSGKTSLTVHPESGLPYFVTEATSTIYRLKQLVSGGVVHEAISIPGIVPQRIQFGPGSRLIVVSAGKFRVFTITDDAEEIAIPDPDHPLDGKDANAMFVMATPRSNDDPAEHDTPAWRQAPAEDLIEIGYETVDCIGDLNDDEIVDGNDLGILLGLWGSSELLGDLNYDGIVDGNDLGTLLGYWGLCPR